LTRSSARTTGIHAIKAAMCSVVLYPGQALVNSRVAP
jgi:hypothetical protein